MADAGRPGGETSLDGQAHDPARSQETVAFSPGDALKLPPASEVADYPFLEPPRSRGELGWLAHYRVRRLIGSGGMGLVFLADDTQLNRPVALKVIRPELASVPQAAARFAREARAAAAIKHDNIVTIYQVGEVGGVAFLAMEYLQGTSLQRWLERGKRPSVDLLLRLAREITSGLAAAHKLGLVHRDIKPGNIWLEAPNGRAKILDFGQARAEREDVQITQSGAIMGTPAYMSPEQAAGEAVDASSDLFSLGCVLYRLTTGQLPFQGKTIIAVLNALSNHTPARPKDLNPEVPESLDTLIMRLLEKDSTRRPASAQDVLNTLREIEKQLATARQAAELGVAPNAALAFADIDPSPVSPAVDPLLPLVPRKLDRPGLDWRLFALPAAAGALVLLAAFLAWPRGEARDATRISDQPTAEVDTERERQSGDETSAPPSIAAETSSSIPTEELPKEGPVEPGPVTVDVRPAPPDPIAPANTDLVETSGEIVNPDGDCGFDRPLEGDTLSIRVPGTPHLLSVELDQLNGPLPGAPIKKEFVNAPRFVRPVRGDFAATVRVEALDLPGSKASTRLYGPYHGAGILIWQDERNYFRFELASEVVSGKARRFLNYEYRQAGRLVSSHSKTLSTPMPYLKVERKGRTILAAYGSDGEGWTPTDPLETTLGDEIRVGLVAINTAAKPLVAEFAAFNVTELRPTGLVGDGVRVQVTPNRPDYGASDPIEVAIEIQNDTAHPVSLPGDRGGERRYRLLVTDTDGKPRARSRDEPPQATPGPVTVLPAGGKLADRIVVKPQDDEWRAGVYTIRVDVILLGPQAGSTVTVASEPARFTIREGGSP